MRVAINGMKSSVPERGRRGDEPPPRRTSVPLSVPTAVLVLVPSLVAAAPVPATRSFDHALDVLLVPSLIAIFVFIGLNAIFVAAETALELLRPAHIKAIERTERQTEQLQSLLQERAKSIAGLALCRQTVMWWMAMFSLVPAAVVVRALERSGSLELNLWSLLAAWLILALPIAGLNIVVGELAPRAYGATRPATAVLRLGGIIRLITTLFHWPSRLLTSVATLATRRFGARAEFAVPNLMEEEIKSLVETGQESGEIEEQEKKLLHSVFEFGDTVAREVMTPRVDIDAAPIHSDPADLIKLIVESGHSRIPVYQDTDDVIVGVIHAKDLLAARLSGEEVNLRTLVRPAMFVPENKNIGDLLAELRKNRTPIAIVQDEFGGTAGLVTIEDIVEELVGEIVDEYDDEEADIVKNGVGWVVQGRTNLYDLNDQIRAHFESEEFDTIGGYVFGLFGRQPSLGEQIDDGAFLFKVEETDGRRILRVHIEPLNRENSALEVV